MAKAWRLGHQKTATFRSSTIASDAFSLRAGFSDFDAFAEAVHDWNVEFVQLESGPFEAVIEQVGTERLQLGRARFGRRLHQMGETPRRLRTFVIPGDAEFRILWRGKEITGNDIGIFPMDGALDSVSLPGFDVLLPSLPQSLLDERSTGLGLPTIDKLAGGSEVIRCEPDAVARLRHWLQTVMSELLKDPEVLRDQQTSDEIAWAISGNILKTLATDRGLVSGASRTPRLRVCDDSLDFIAAHPGRSLTVREVADAVGVSERTLRRAFQDRFGVSTKEYIKARRLRATRRDLFRLSPDETQVRQVALRWGFWHSSQFAQDYHRAFGELPSDTLRRHVDQGSDSVTSIPNQDCPRKAVPGQ